MEEILKHKVFTAGMKRLVVFLATSALIVLNKKLNLGMGTEEIAGLALTATGYIYQSGMKDGEVQAAKVAAASSAASIKTIDDAAKELQKHPLP